MAKVIENEKGFKVIQASRMEIVSHVGGVGICDRCNKSPQTGFYIAVLNQWFCPECYEDWYKRAVYYPEDARIENKNFNFYKQLLGV